MRQNQPTPSADRGQTESDHEKDRHGRSDTKRQTDTDRQSDRANKQSKRPTTDTETDQDRERTQSDTENPTESQKRFFDGCPKNLKPKFRRRAIFFDVLMVLYLFYGMPLFAHILTSDGFL